MSRITMLVGLPGSGKSTIAKQLQDIYGATVVCPDDIRKELTGDVNDQSRNTEVFKIAENRIYESILGDKDVIYDATNVHRINRMDLIRKIRTFSENYIVECVVLVPTLEEVRRRNSDRPRKVPNTVIDMMLSRWETPMKFEGFDHIYINHGGDDEDSEFLRAYDHVRSCYDGKLSYDVPGHGNITKEIAQYHIDLIQLSIKQKPGCNSANYHDWRSITSDDISVASTFVRCGEGILQPDGDNDAYCHVGAYIALTYLYDGLQVDPLLVSYMVECHKCGADLWLTRVDNHAFDCVRSIHKICESVGFCDKLIGSD